MFESIFVFKASTANLLVCNPEGTVAVIFLLSYFSANSILFIISWSSLLSSLKMSSSYTFLSFGFFSFTFNGFEIVLLCYEEIFFKLVAFLLICSTFLSFSFVYFSAALDFGYSWFFVLFTFFISLWCFSLFTYSYLGFSLCFFSCFSFTSCFFSYFLECYSFLWVCDEWD